MDLSRIDLYLRLMKTASFVGRAVDDAAKAYNLKEGEWNVLAALRRQGPPFCLTPTALSKTILTTTGAMTRRIDRLEQAGLVARAPDPSDRRGVRVSLTPDGILMADAAATATFAVAHELMGTLSTDERDMVSRCLGTMLTRMEHLPAPKAASQSCLPQ